MIHIETGHPGTRLPTVLVENLLVDAVALPVGGGDPSLAINGATYDFWSPSTSNASIQFALASVATFDCLCIAAHDLATKNATIGVRVGGTEIASFAPQDDRAIMMLFPAASSNAVEIALSGSSAPCHIGVLMLGAATTFQRGIAEGHVPTEWADNSEILGGLTLSGQFLPQRVIRKSGETDIDLVVQDEAWWRVNGAAIRDAFNNGRPFFYAGAPSLWANDIAYCWRAPSSRNLRPTLQFGGFVSVRLEVNFYV